MSLAQIRKELEQRLEALAYRWSWLISWENAPFNTEAYDGTFIEAFIIPAATLNASLNGIRVRHLGIFHLNIWTRDGIGAGEAETILQRICDVFVVIPKTGNVSIEKPPYAGKSYFNNGWRITPVTINYRSEQ